MWRIVLSTSVNPRVFRVDALIPVARRLSLYSLDHDSLDARVVRGQ